MVAGNAARLPVLLLLGLGLLVLQAEARPRRPVCNGRVALPPVKGELHEWRSDGKPGGNRAATNSAWELVTRGGCSYALREGPQLHSCLKGTWIVLIGASNTNIWTAQLANLLAPHTLDTKRDGFTIDGTFTQLLDVIIEDGKLVYKKVIVDSRALASSKSARGQARNGAHTYTRDHTVLKQAFRRISEAPAYTGRGVRVTNFLAQYWDNVDLAVQTVEEELGWREAQVSLTVSVGIWYKNAFQCRWQCTRPTYSKFSADKVHKQYMHGLKFVLPKLKRFCAPGGRSGDRGCAVTSIEHCPLMKIPFWRHLADDVAVIMKERATPSVRFVDLWTFTGQIPEACLQGHQTPMSALLTWQVLLGGICGDSAAARGSLAIFNGEQCRAAQVMKKCAFSKLKGLGYNYLWDCAISRTLCWITAIEPESSMSVVSKTGRYLEEASDSATVRGDSGAVAAGRGSPGAAPKVPADEEAEAHAAGPRFGAAQLGLAVAGAAAIAAGAACGVWRFGQSTYGVGTLEAVSSYRPGSDQESTAVLIQPNSRD